MFKFTRQSPLIISAQSGGNDPPRAKRVADLLDFEFPDISCYIEPQILPKSATLIFGGEAKIGKSFMMIEFARALTCRRAPFDYHQFHVPERARVLLVEQELGPITLKRRLHKVFDAVPRDEWADYLFYESKRPELSLDDPEGQQYFADMIAETKPNVLILDPISMMHAYDENSSTDIAKLFRTLEFFKQINPEQEMAVILSHHFKKPQLGKDGAPASALDRLCPYQFAGSRKWKDTPDTICTMYRSKTLDVPWDAWEINTRWITRHESSPPDMVLTVNAHNDDGRVRFARARAAALPKLEEGPFKEVPLKKKEELDAEQKKFAFRAV